MYTAHSKMNVCLQIKNLEMFCGETVSRKSCIFKFCSLEQTRIKEMLCVVAQYVRYYKCYVLCSLFILLVKITKDKMSTMFAEFSFSMQHRNSVPWWSMTWRITACAQNSGWQSDWNSESPGSCFKIGFLFPLQFFLH